MVIIFSAHTVIQALLNTSFWYPFLEPHQTTYHSVNTLESDLQCDSNVHTIYQKSLSSFKSEHHIFLGTSSLGQYSMNKRGKEILLDKPSPKKFISKGKMKKNKNFSVGNNISISVVSTANLLKDVNYYYCVTHKSSSISTLIKLTTSQIQWLEVLCKSFPNILPLNLQSSSYKTSFGSPRLMQ